MNKVYFWLQIMIYKSLCRVNFELHICVLLTYKYTVNSILLKYYFISIIYIDREKYNLYLFISIINMQ